MHTPGTPTWRASGSHAHRIRCGVTLHSMEPLRPWKSRPARQRLSALELDREEPPVEGADRASRSRGACATTSSSTFKVDPAKVVVIHNGIDPDRFRRTEARDVWRAGASASPTCCRRAPITDQKGNLSSARGRRRSFRRTSRWSVRSRARPPEIEARLKRALPEHPNVLWHRDDPGGEVVSSTARGGLRCPSVYEPFGLINLEAWRGDAVSPRRSAAFSGGRDGRPACSSSPPDPRRWPRDPPLARRSGARPARKGRAGRLRVEAHFAGAASGRAHPRGLPRPRSTSSRGRRPSGVPALNLSTLAASSSTSTAASGTATSSTPARPRRSPRSTGAGARAPSSRHILAESARTRLARARSGWSAASVSGRAGVEDVAVPDAAVEVEDRSREGREVQGRQRR